jgi:hypothetical protein
MFPIDVLRFSEFRTMRNHLSETLMLNDIQITSDYMSRWAVLPIVSYSYTNSIGRKIFNYKEVLQDINIEEYLKNPLNEEVQIELV